VLSDRIRFTNTTSPPGVIISTSAPVQTLAPRLSHCQGAQLDAENSQHEGRILSLRQTSQHLRDPYRMADCTSQIRSLNAAVNQVWPELIGCPPHLVLDASDRGNKSGPSNVDRLIWIRSSSLFAKTFLCAYCRDSSSTSERR